MAAPPPKISLGEKVLVAASRAVLKNVIGAALENWGPTDLSIAIGTDADLCLAAQQAHPELMRWAQGAVRGMRPPDETFSDSVVYEFIKKNYPNLIEFAGLELLGSPKGRAWLTRNIARFRTFFWPSQ